MSDKLLNSAEVRARLGGISDMTLHRHVNDPAKGFPAPIYIGRRRYWQEADLAAWIAAQRGNAAPPAPCGLTATGRAAGREARAERVAA